MHTRTPQAAGSTGRIPLRRLAILIAGTAGIGLGTALLLRAELGMLPMDILQVGVAEQLGLSVGGGIAVTQAVLLISFAPLRVRVGPGTIAGLLVPAVSADVVLDMLPAGAPLAARLLFLLSGALLFCCGVALYLSTRLGPMPRDGLLTVLTRRHPTRLGLTRAGLDVAFVLLGGALLLGNAASITSTIGAATIVLALVSGPVIGILVRAIGRVS